MNIKINKNGAGLLHSPSSSGRDRCVKAFRKCVINKGVKSTLGPRKKNLQKSTVLSQLVLKQPSVTLVAIVLFVRKH